MINDSQRQHIARLKQQPRHGMADDFGDALKKFNEQLKNLGDGASDMVRENAFSRLAKSVQDLTDKVTILAQRNTTLQQSLNLNQEAAAELGYIIDDTANGLEINSAKMRVYAGELNKLTKGFSKQVMAGNKNNKMHLQQYDIMRNQLKLTADQAVSLTRASAAKRINIKLIAQEVKGIEEQTKQVGLVTDVMEQLADAGSYIQMAYAKVPGDIAKAAAKANMLGMSFKELVSTSNKFLDIESSIGAELEMQLLSGKKINSEKFRQAAVEQDMNKMADAMKELMETMGENAMDNLFVQQSLTNVTGLEADRLAEVWGQLQANGELLDDAEQSWQKISQAQASATGSAEIFAGEDKRTQTEIQQDAAQLEYTKEILKLGDPSKRITEINNTLNTMQTTILGAATAFGEQITKLVGADNIATLLGAGLAFNTAQELYSDIKNAKLNAENLYIGEDVTGMSGASGKGAGDVYMSPAMGNAIYSAKENTLFNLSPKDEVAAAPGLGAMLSKRGGDTPAFNVYVTNKFELDQLITAVDIRRSERMNG